jgi:hypothetical protein
VLQLNLGEHDLRAFSYSPMEFDLSVYGAFRFRRRAKSKRSEHSARDGLHRQIAKTNSL